MAGLLDLLGYSDTKYPSATVHSEYTPSGSVGTVYHPDPRWKGLNPSRVNEMPSPVLHPLPIDLVKSYTEDWTPSAAEKLLKELEQHQESGDIDAYNESVISLYAGSKEHELEVSRKSSALEAFHQARMFLPPEQVGPRGTPPHNVEEHELAHVVLSNPKFIEAYKKVGKREGFYPFIGHNLEEATIRYMEQAQDIKSILKDYADARLPIINDPNIWKNSDKTLSTKDAAAGNKPLNALAGMMYDHVSGPEGRRPYSKYERMTREEAVADLAFRAEKLHRAVGEVLENVPLVVEEMESEEAVQKFAKGGLVDTGPKLTGEPTPYALANGLATLGRYGDNYMVHASDGETVVPGEILAANPRLKEDLFRQMRMMGVQDPNRYVVGNGLNSINPVTGQPEFFFKKLLSFALPIIGGYLGGPAGAGVGGFLGSKLSGVPTKDALMNAALATGSAYAMRGIGSMDKEGGFWGGVKGTPFLGGKLFPGGAPTISGGALDKRRYPGVVPRHQRYTPAVGEKYIRPRYEGPQLLNPDYEAASYGEWIDPDYDLAQRGASASGDEGTGIAGWWKKRSGLEQLGLGLGAAGSVAALTGAFDTKKEAEEGQAGRSARERAYDELTELPHTLRFNEDGTPTDIAQTLMAQAGLGPSFTAGQLGPAAGITPDQAEEYLRQTYGIVAARGGAISGPGTGTSDDIPARLSDGEFVMTADAVRGAGNGNRQRGAAKMYNMMHQFERVA